MCIYVVCKRPEPIRGLAKLFRVAMKRLSKVFCASFTTGVPLKNRTLTINYFASPSTRTSSKSTERGLVSSLKTEFCWKLSFVDSFLREWAMGLIL